MRLSDGRDSARCEGMRPSQWRAPRKCSPSVDPSAGRRGVNNGVEIAGRHVARRVFDGNEPVEGSASGVKACERSCKGQEEKEQSQR